MSISPQQRIRLARRHVNLSQAQLASAVGVQRSAVSHWEAPNGKNPSLANLREVAIITRVHFEWLATGRGAMTLSRDEVLDSVATTEALLVEDILETRLVNAFRDAPARARISVVEVVEQLATQRHGRTKARSEPGL